MKTNLPILTILFIVSIFAIMIIFHKCNTSNISDVNSWAVQTAIDSVKSEQRAKKVAILDSLTAVSKSEIEKAQKNAEKYRKESITSRLETRRLKIKLDSLQNATCEEQLEVCFDVNTSLERDLELCDSLSSELATEAMDCSEALYTTEKKVELLYAQIGDDFKMKEAYKQEKKALEKEIRKHKFWHKVKNVGIIVLSSLVLLK
jgi:hypothetical protein